MHEVLLEIHYILNNIRPLINVTLLVLGSISFLWFIK